jgi:pimeloyl-ACP methyl ester carboxylesterase
VTDAEPIEPPWPAYLLLEGRAWLELASLPFAYPFLQQAPPGDGHPILVLPGWLGDDRSTRALRWFLRNRGYHVHRWGLGRNLGPSTPLIEGMHARLADLRARHGRRVSLIGWSLGGVYARELARRFPDDVRQVITLASPFRDLGANTVARLYRSGLLPRSVPAGAGQVFRAAPPVPCTALYSRTDGIVAWQSCLEDEDAERENIHVPSSHCGMGHHPLALWVIADRLAQPEGTWRPFDRAHAPLPDAAPGWRPPTVAAAARWVLGLGASNGAAR